MTLQEQMLESGYNSGDPTRRSAALAAGYVPPAGLSGTGTPPPGGAPVLPGATPTLPQSGDTSGSGSLVDFHNALTKAIDIARKNRNQSSVDIASPYSGSVGAGSFADIVGALNKSSENRLSDIQKKVTPDASNIATFTNDSGTVTAINRATGEVVWQKAGIGNQQTAGGTASTLFERSAQALSSYSSAFTAGHYLPSGIPTIDAEGFITPEAWKAAIAEAPSKGLTRAEFIKQFGYMITTQGQVSPKYGLTPVEQHLVLGTGQSLEAALSAAFPGQ